MMLGDESKDNHSGDHSVVPGDPEESLFSENQRVEDTSRQGSLTSPLTEANSPNTQIKELLIDENFENIKEDTEFFGEKGRKSKSNSLNTEEDISDRVMAESGQMFFADEMCEDEYYSYTSKKPLHPDEEVDDKNSLTIYQYSKEPFQNSSQPNTPARSKFLILSSNTSKEPNRAMRLDQVADRIYAAVSPAVDASNKKEYINYLRLTKNRLQELTKDAQIKVFCASDTPKDLTYFFEKTISVNIRTDSPPELAKFVSFCDTFYDWLAQPTNQITLIHTCGDFSRLLLLLLAYTNYYEKIDRHEVKTILSLKSYINAHCIFMTNLPASFRRYAAYMSRCSVDRMSITKASVSLHALVLYSFPVMEKEKNMACKLFFKVYTNKPMKSVHTTRVYCLPAVVNRLVILFDNAPVTLNNDVMIVCYHKSDSLPSRKRILKLIFNTCEVTSDICSFERRDFDEVYDAAPLKMKLDLYFKATAAFGQDQQENLMVESDFEETVRIRDSFENLRDSLLYSSNSYKSKQTNMTTEESISPKSKVMAPKISTRSPPISARHMSTTSQGRAKSVSITTNGHNKAESLPRSAKLAPLNSNNTFAGPQTKPPTNRYYNSNFMMRDQQDSQDLDQLLDDLKSEGKKHDDGSMRQEMLSEKEKRLMHELIETKRELALMQRARSVTNEPRASQYLYNHVSNEQSPVRHVELATHSGRRSTSVEPRQRHVSGQSWKYPQAPDGMLTSACSFHALSPKEQSDSIDEAINNLDRAIATLSSPGVQNSTRTKTDGILSLKNVKLRATSMKHLVPETQTARNGSALSHYNSMVQGDHKAGMFPVDPSDYNQASICPIRTHSQMNVNHSDGGRGFVSKYNISDSNIHSSMPKRRENLSLVTNYSAHREQIRQAMEQSPGADVIEDIETVSLQPIGKGVQDLNTSSTNFMKENSTNNQSAMQIRSLPREANILHTELSPIDVVSSPNTHVTSQLGRNSGAPLSPGATSTGLSRASSIGSSVGHITCDQLTLKHVQLTTKIWLQPYITRDEAISQLKGKPCGTFIVRDSNTFTNSYGLAVKVPFIPSKVTSKADDSDSEVVRHYLIEPVFGVNLGDRSSQTGVRLKGFANEPNFHSLAALIFQHALAPMALPCRLLLPGCQPSTSSAMPSSNYENFASLMMTQPCGSDSNSTLHGSIQQLKNPSVPKGVGASCIVLYIGVKETDSSGSNAIKRTIDVLVTPDQPIRTTECLLKASPSEGIVLIDNLRKLFVKRNFPARMISYAGVDPRNRGYDGPDVLSRGLNNARLFGFVTKRHEKNKKIYTTHILCEIDLSQPASALVKYITKKVIGR